MKFYRVTLYETADGHRGFDWFRSKQFAERRADGWRRIHHDDEGASATIEEISIPLTKAGILDALTRYASHPDNG